MKRAMVFLLALLLLPGLLGCGQKEGAEQIRIYYPVLASDSYDSPAIREEIWTEAPQSVTAEDLIRRMAMPPAEEGLSPALPEGTVLRNWTLENGVLKLNFSEAYNELTGISLTLSNYCTVLTCAQLDGVEQVAITVEGEPLPEGDPGPFRPEDILLSGDLGAQED